MNENQNEILIGEIIFWNGIFGFVQKSDGLSIFFHKSSINISYYETKLLDVVSFEISIAISGKHKGKQIAINIKFISRVDLLKKKRYIGKITNWDGRWGTIISPQQLKSVTLFNTRKLYPNDKFHNEDLVVFSQVKSSKNQDQLFAVFAYSISSEKDLVFLQQAYQDSQLVGIKTYIEKLYLENNSFTKHELFEFELNQLEDFDGYDFFSKLINLINKFKKENYYPTTSLLKKYCAEKYLIQLWEMDIISDYDTNLVKEYFYRTSAENKRIIILKINEVEKVDILRYYFESLKKEGYLQQINNNIKTLLDISYKNEESRNVEIYKEIKEYLCSNLFPNEIISLWLDGYIDNLDETLIIENFDINNSKLLKVLLSQKDKKHNELIRKIFENYFSEVVNNKDFEIEFPQLVIRLINFEKEFKDRYNGIIKVITNLLNDKQKFILWIFNVTIEFDSYDYLKNSHTELNDFYKIKFFIHKSIDSNNQLIVELLDHVNINQDGLLNYILSSPWNEFIHLTEITPQDQNQCYFLPNIKDFIKKYNYVELNIESFSLEIFEQINKYTIQHIRLWLYEYVNENLYNYIGFRSSFRFLTTEEQTHFKRKGEISSWISDVVQPEISEVENCMKIISEDSDYKEYEAYLENLYFRDGSFMLRKEDGNYTEPKHEKYSSSGLNRIPSSSEFNTLPIIIKVSYENKIVNFKGLNVLFSKLHTGEIEKTLGKIVDTGYKYKSKDKSYSEDVKLKKEVIAFLDKEQLKGLEPKHILEPKNFFRRLDINSGIDSLELTKLFTIKTTDGFGLVWENIDLTEDRATYVFKSLPETLDSQIEKISNGIVTLAQLRSALLSTNESSEMEIFKSNFGLIGSIRKQRGKNHSFSNWQTKLKILLTKEIPNIPSELELDKIKNWSPEIPHYSPVINRSTILHNEKKQRLENKKRPKEIKDEDNEISDFGFDIDIDNGINQTINPINSHSKSLSKKQGILNALQSLNNIFSENLKQQETKYYDHQIIANINFDKKPLFLNVPSMAIEDGIYECEIVDGGTIKFMMYMGSEIAKIKVCISGFQPFYASIENVSLAEFVTNLYRFMTVQISTNERGYKIASLKKI